MNTNIYVTRTEMLACFNGQITRIGHQFLANLLENDLTNGEVRDSIAERLRVNITAAQDEFVEHARQEGFKLLGDTSKIRIESPRVFKFVEATSSLAIGFLGWNGGVMAGATVLKTVTHGMLWWKSMSVITVASTMAGLGISPIVLPLAAAVLPAAVGWKVSKGLMRRQRLKKLRSAFDDQLSTLRSELNQWASGILGPNPEREPRGSSERPDSHTAVLPA